MQDDYDYPQFGLAISITLEYYGAQ